jgi:flagellar protein FliS
MVPGKAHEHYKENSVYTAKPEDLTLMLYNGIVKFIMKAQSAITARDFEKANEYIKRAEDIISELNFTLDMSFEISQNLRALYLFMKKRLLDANIKKDNEILNEVLELVKDLRDTWMQAIKLMRSGKSLDREEELEKLAK